MVTLAAGKKQLILIVMVTIACIVALVFLNNDNSDSQKNNDDGVEKGAEETASTDDLIDLTVYLQNKEEVILNDCGITYPEKIQVPKTVAVADASLRYLFTEELSGYGRYESVVINDGIAQVTISNDNDPKGYKISGLSSCEARHLTSVLKDTLTQYESIESVELFSPSGKIEF